MSIQDEVLPAWLLVGFSGHRHLSNPAAVEAALRRLLDRLEQRTGHLVGVSSAALGADTLFAEEMIRRGHPIRVVLPFPAARFEQDFVDAPEAWTRARAVIDAAIDVDVVGASEVDNQTPEDAYLEAGFRTVDESDVLIAVWDQQPVKGRGGTADIVAYARSIGRPVVLIDPDTGAVTDQELDRFRIGKDQPSLDSSRSSRAVVEAYYAAVNRRAEGHAPIVRELMRWCVLLHLGASTLTTGAMIFGTDKPTALAVTGVDTALLAVAFVMLWMRGRRHREWRRLRAEAEICRSALATWDIRRGSRPPVRAPLPGLAGLSRSLDLLRQMDRSPIRALDDARKRYGTERILDQMNYFTAKHAVAHRQVTRRKILMAILTAIGIASAVASAAILVRGIDWPVAENWFDFFSIVAPLGASALGVLLITDESARRHERYAQMITALQGWLPRLQECRTWDSLGRLSTMVEDQLLQEVVEWRSFAKYTENVE